MKKILKGFGVVLIVLLAAALIVPFLVPVPPLEGKVSERSLADPDSQFIQVNNLTVHYKEAGQGKPTFILLHGFAASVFSWREVIQPLSVYGRVIAFDRPAFGLTSRPIDWDGPSPYSPQSQVDLTIALMDKLGVEKAILVGNSAGGTIAILTALAHPDRVQALILVDAAVYGSGGSPSIFRALFNTPQVNHLGPLIARNIERWGKDFAASAWHNPSRITPEIWAGYLKPMQIQNWDRALWELTRASNLQDIPARLKDIQLPALVVTGDDDRIVLTEQSLRLAKELPGASLSVIPACGHVPQEECPAAFMQAVDHFLNGLILPKAGLSQTTSRSGFYKDTYHAVQSN
jgi:pimeloyl-ACP methyl ester carboxylesterase